MNEIGLKVSRFQYESCKTPPANSFKINWRHFSFINQVFAKKLEVIGSASSPSLVLLSATN